MNYLQSNNWNVLKSPWYFCALTLFILHQLLQWIIKVNIPFADNYLDPFLFLPVVLGAYLQERRFILKNNKYTLDYFRVIGLSIILSVIVEVVFPLINTGYSFDFYDFVAYGAGSVYFHFTINKSSRPEGHIIHDLH